VSAKSSLVPPQPAPAGLPAKHHVLYVDVPDESENPPARIAALDEALSIEQRNEAREHEVLDSVRRLLGDDPAVEHLEASCGQTFCRLSIDKPVGFGMPWHEIDSALRPMLPGETIIQTEMNGGLGYVYFSERDGYLPL
jgi:hypothetical protein